MEMTSGWRMVNKKDCNILRSPCSTSSFVINNKMPREKVVYQYRCDEVCCHLKVRSDKWNEHCAKKHPYKFARYVQFYQVPHLNLTLTVRNVIPASRQQTMYVIYFVLHSYCQKLWKSLKICDTRAKCPNVGPILAPGQFTLGGRCKMRRSALKMNANMSQASFRCIVGLIVGHTIE